MSVAVQRIQSQGHDGAIFQAGQRHEVGHSADGGQFQQAAQDGVPFGVLDQQGLGQFEADAACGEVDVVVGALALWRAQDDGVLGDVRTCRQVVIADQYVHAVGFCRRGGGVIPNPNVSGDDQAHTIRSGRFCRMDREAVALAETVGDVVVEAALRGRQLQGRLKDK